MDVPVLAQRRSLCQALCSKLMMGLGLQGDGEVRRREDLRRRQTKPTTTLFIVNFDVDKTRERDLEKHFEPFGKLRRVQIKRNYAFIQYEDVDQSADALKACNGTCLAGCLSLSSSVAPFL